ncbi:MAG TPA: YbaB/EbfC family nucleoid-associated protein [Planctomycetota bacterium]|jgi:DNA-binding YbaB/EbfC family protein|nr:YbaB/EbfC family nucleoid-associated protein [Planctomycetota bacterium]
MLPGGMNLGKFGKQFEDMQKKLARLEEDLKERVVEAASGGGMVKVKVNGAEEVVDIKIEPEVISPDDKGMLEDLVLAAVNEGIKKAKKLREGELARITGLSLPGLM